MPVARWRHEEFIRASTAIAAAPLVPEIRLHLATEVTPLWHATGAYLQQMDIEPPFWAFAWVGGQALSRYVLDHPEVVAGRSVLDIGAGGGIVSIAAVLAWARHVMALDVDPLAAAACRLNATLNDTADRITTETADATGCELGSFDLVLAGDVCYARGESELLVHRLRECTAPVLLGDPGRQFLPREGVHRIATYAVPTSREIEAAAVTEASVWRIDHTT
jgi:predicted nicotinamide N-methyase